MKNKILIVSILAALLMVSIPFVSTIQATTAPISTTSIHTIQKLKDKSQDITSVQEAVSTLLQIKMSTSDPEAQALASQTIQLVSTNSIDCDNLAVYIDAADILAALAWSSYDLYGSIAALILALTYDALSGVLSFFYAIFCAGHTTSISILSSTNTFTPITSTRTCSLCAQ